MKESALYTDMDYTLCGYKCMEQSKVNSALKYLKGFFCSLTPIEGTIETINELRHPYEVYMLTAPWYKNPLCYIGKRLRIEKHFGPEFTKNLIICAHKNLLQGDVLIDDY